MDGAMGSRGASLFDPYSDDLKNCGLLRWNEEDLDSILKQAKDMGFQVAIHAIGDKAAHMILNAYEKIGVKGLRWRIEHAQQLSEQDIKRFGELGVIAAMQPLHMIEDMNWIENRLGKESVQSGAFMLRSLLSTGATITGGSDAPVVDFNPLWGMYAAITREDFNGTPKGGWYPDQKITPYEALKMYTIDAAYSCFSENEIGSITKGKLADLAVLPENLLTCPPNSLLNMKVLYTFVNGKISFALDSLS
jgi:predicted amidohydrolase YtcJ